MTRFTWILALTVAVGCGDDKNDTTGSTGGGSSSTDATSTTTTTTTTTPTTTDNSGTMGGSQTMGETTVGPGSATEATTTTTTTTDGTTGGSSDGTTGGGNADIPAACKAVCDKGITECMIADLGDNVDFCAMGCTADLGGSMGACADATVAYLGCLAALDCMALLDVIANDNPGSCTDAAIAVEMACGGGGECTTGIGGNPQMTECSVSIDCPNQPLQEMNCAGKQCVCLVDGQKTGMCPAMDICLTPDALPQKATDCCGF